MLLTALALAVIDWCRRRGRGDESAILLELEGHGREEIFADVDLSRTVGWFTSLHPMRLDAEGIDLDDALAGGRAPGVRGPMHATLDVSGCRGFVLGARREVERVKAKKVAV